MFCCLQFTVWYCISPSPCAVALRSPVDASASQAITTQASWLSEVLQPLLLAQGSVLLQLFQLWGVLAALSGRKTQGGGGGGGRFKELWEQAGPTCHVLTAWSPPSSRTTWGFMIHVIYWGNNAIWYMAPILWFIWSLRMGD